MLGAFQDMEMAWTGNQSFIEQTETHFFMLKFTLMSKFESPVSLDLHVFAKWEETGAAKANI